MASDMKPFGMLVLLQVNNKSFPFLKEGLGFSDNVNSFLPFRTVFCFSSPFAQRETHGEFMIILPNTNRGQGL